ncbi:MAG: ABC transporter permease, partial [Nitriliruptorales bacterium]
LIARQAALALRPEAPSLLSVVPPPDPRDLKSGVASDVNALFLLLAALAVIVGALGIANTTLVAILERTAEIGLRRSLGARPRHIAAQFLAESSALGALGGLMGATCGAVTVVLVSWQRGWTAIMSSEYVLPGPVVGGLIGLLAGLYPALRAARIEPVDALRH